MIETRPFQKTDDMLAVSNIYEQSWKCAYRGIIPDECLDGIPSGQWANGMNVSGRHSLLLYDNDKLLTRELLLNDEFSQWAVTTPLYNIGEQVYKLSNELKKEKPEFPWSVVSGLRHRLVHDYEGINWSIIDEVTLMRWMIL